MIKSNTNMEENGELESPRPPGIMRRSLSLFTGIRRPSLSLFTAAAVLLMAAAILLMMRIINGRTEEERVIIFFSLFALFHFIIIAHSLRDLGRPERGKISCINVYLLGNGGAHAYNGNGQLFSRQRKSIKYAPLDEEDIDLNREPTNEEITLIAQELAEENIKIAYLLRVGRVKVQQIIMDNPTTERRNMEILFHWRDVVHRDGGATIEMLEKALNKAKVNPKKVLANIH